jgi:hypothetical protein
MHYANDQELDLVEKIKNVEFEETGKLKLIDERMYGEEHRYYVAIDSDDVNFEELQEFVEELKSLNYSDFENRKFCKIKIEPKLKSMAGRIVQIRIKHSECPPLASAMICLGLQKLDPNCYNQKTGVILSSKNQII